METTDLISLQEQLISKQVTCEQVIGHFLEKIKATKALNIYVEVFEDEALKRAIYLDQKIRSNQIQLGKLFGLVVSIKDVLCYQGHAVTAGSKILQGFESSYNATAIQRLLDEDAIIIGRTNCDEFAMGSTNENSFYGPTINGCGENRIPGGSSGASAVSVQMDTCMVALGSDTGGSVRQPAGFCGVIGLKPTYGRISRYGLIAYASSFDQIGILSKNVSNIAKTLECIAGEDDYDGTCSKRPVEQYSTSLSTKPSSKRIAVFDIALKHPSMQKEVREATLKYLEELKKMGHEVERVKFDLLDFAVPAYYVLTTAEASSNLSRYDGVRYGYRSKDVSNIHEVFTKSRTEGFGDEVKRRIMLGTFVLSTGYYDAYYGKAQRVRKLFKEKIDKLFADFDVLVLPIAPFTAWEIGEKADDPIAVYLSDIFTVLANLTGNPGISIPISADKDGMPIGLQLISQNFSEADLLSFAHNTLI